jgi:prepilin-type N-terminal cleavage/methylation domain-containing protein/prepilin-type processing-associated H-X9-DG protein
MRRRGFSLIELLIVVFIVFVLTSLFLPALSSSREASRRTGCINNLRQIGLGIHNYNFNHAVIVPGRIWRGGENPCGLVVGDECQDTPWQVMLLPFMEQQGIYSTINFQLGTWGPGAAGYRTMRSGVSTSMSAFRCPTDGDGLFQFPSSISSASIAAVVVSRCNYAANWGNTTWSQGDLKGQPGAIHLRSPFGHRGNMRFEQVSDGMSQTVFVAEILRGAENDLRGAFWISQAGSSMYMSGLTPNGLKHRYGLNQGRGDYLVAPELCVDDPQKGLPCTGNPAGRPGPTFAGSRSGHPGGVNALMGDGSIRFQRDTISPDVWIAIHSIAGREIVGGRGY